jgi:hypothetical protein
MSEEKCENSDKNPLCPYLTDIRQLQNDVKLMKVALVGEDLQGGLVEKVNRMEIAYKVLIFIGGATFSGLLALFIKMIG